MKGKERHPGKTIKGARNGEYVVVYKTYGLCFSNNFAKTYHCLKQTL
jgi:hypothetical protein